MIIKTITPEFTDERGEIRNLPIPHEGADMLYLAQNFAVITSKAGSVRSNHWHRRSSHWIYLVSGRMTYYERAVGEKEWLFAADITPGQAVFTGPCIEHRTEFPEDSVFISISDMPQTTAEHEEDVVRIQ